MPRVVRGGYHSYPLKSWFGLMPISAPTLSPTMNTTFGLVVNSLPPTHDREAILTARFDLLGAE